MNARTVFSDIEPWPDAPRSEANPRAVVGGNKPPLEELIPQEFREALLAERPDFLTKLDQIVGKLPEPDADPEAPVDKGAVGRVVVTNDDELGRAGDLVKLIRACAAHVDAVHKVVKQPYLEGSRLVDAEKNALAHRIAGAKADVEEIANAYVAKREAEAKALRDRIAAEQRAAAERAAQAERDRIAAERKAEEELAAANSAAEREAARERAAEAARIADQAAAAAALAPATPVKSEPLRSDAGATVSASKDWACEVEDYTKAFRAVKADPKVREAIDAAIKRTVKQTKGNLEIPGVRIWPVSRANFR
jgi:hypothetical protein